MYRRRAKDSHGGAIRNQQRSHCSNAKQMVRRPITRSLTTRVTRSGRKLCCLHHHQYVVSNIDIITTQHKPKSCKSGSNPCVYIHKQLKPHLDDDAKRLKALGSNKRSLAVGLDNVRSDAFIRAAKRLIVSSPSSTPCLMTSKPDVDLLSASSVAAERLEAACNHDGEAQSVSTSSSSSPEKPDHLMHEDHQLAHFTNLRVEDKNFDCRSSSLIDHNHDNRLTRLAVQSEMSSSSCTLHNDRCMINNDRLYDHHQKSCLGSTNLTIVDNDHSKNTSTKQDSSSLIIRNSYNTDEAITVPENKDSLEFHINHAHDPPLPSSAALSSSSSSSFLSSSAICYGNKSSPAASRSLPSSFSSESSSLSSSFSSSSSSVRDLHAANINIENQSSVKLSPSVERHETIGGAINVFKVGLPEPVTISTTRKISIGAGPCPSQLPLVHPISLAANDTATSEHNINDTAPDETLASDYARDLHADQPFPNNRYKEAGTSIPGLKYVHP